MKQILDGNFLLDLFCKKLEPRFIMTTASKLSALAPSYDGIGDQLKSWFSNYNLFLEARNIALEEKLQDVIFTEISTAQTLLLQEPKRFLLLAVIVVLKLII